MRKVIVSEFVTLDGIMEAPDKRSFQFWNEEIGKYKFNELFASDALLLGRVTYQIFADSWPSLTDEENLLRVKEAGGDTGAIQADMGKGNPFADRMNSISKFVVSTTLEEVEWNNSSLIKGNIAEEVSKLKRQPGQNILVAGSGDLVHTLMQHDLIDEYRLMVFPIVLGSGKRLFKDGNDKKVLTLVNTKTFRSGVVVLSYKPAGGGGKIT
jgi:dihydrofolate reductase